MAEGLAKRKKVMKSPQWWLLLLLLVLFAPFLLQSGTVLFSPHSDFVVVHFPARYMFSDSLRSYASLPLWTPYQFCGSPQLGDWHCQWFYPLTWLYALVPPLDTLRMMGFQVAVHLLLGGLGMFHYLKAQGSSRLACLLGAIVFMLNGKWVAHLLVAQHPIQGWAWLPWVMASMDRLQSRPRLTETARLACLVSLLMLGSIPPFIALCVYFLAPYGGFLVARSKQPLKLALHLTGACLWSGLVCCSTLWPAAEFAGLCTRGSGLTLAQASQGQIPIQILPFLPGWPSSPLSVGWEMTLYCGAVPLLLAVLALCRRPSPKEAYFLSASAVLLVLALGQQTPLFGLCFYLLPGFSLFRYPARFCLLLGVSLSYLAARQLDQPRPLPGPALAALSLVALLLAVAGQAWFGRSEGWFCFALVCLAAATRISSKSRVFLVALSAAELAWFSYGLIEPRPFQEVLKPHLIAEQLHQPLGQARALATVSQMLPLPYATLNSVESANGLTALIPKVSLDYLQRGVCDSKPEQHGVITGIPVLEPRSQAYLRRGNIVSVLSERPLQLDWPSRTTPTFPAYDFQQATGYIQYPPFLCYQDERPLPRYRLVGRALTANDQEAAVQLAIQQDPERTVVVEGPVQPSSEQRAPVGWSYANYQKRELAVEVSAPGAYLVLSEPYYPGWVLRSKNQTLPLLRADGYFLAAYLPAGSHRLSLEYAPSSFPRSLWLSALALLAALGAAAPRRTKEMPAPEATP